jgi:hypothetical protein
VACEVILERKFIDQVIAKIKKASQQSYDARYCIRIKKRSVSEYAPFEEIYYLERN